MALPIANYPNGNAIFARYEFRKIFFREDSRLAVRREVFTQGADTGLHQIEDFGSVYAIVRGRGVHWVNGYPHAIVRGDVYILRPTFSIK